MERDHIKVFQPLTATQLMHFQQASKPRLSSTLMNQRERKQKETHGSSQENKSEDQAGQIRQDSWGRN